MTGPLPVNEQTIPSLSPKPGQVIADELGAGAMPKGFDIDAAARLIAVTDVFTGDVGGTAIRAVRKMGRTTIDVTDIDAAVDTVRSRTYRSDIRSWLGNLCSLSFGAGVTCVIAGATVPQSSQAFVWIGGAISLLGFIGFLLCIPRKN